MRGVIAILLIVAVAVAGAIVAADEHDAGEYRFAVVFDTGKGMVPGQLVKIAGARVGTIEDVGLTPDHKARMVLAIDDAFGPFRDDASCKILPEGFISENFVQCEPGTPGRPELAAAKGTSLPTVPLGRTSVSVDLQQVIDTFSLPVSQRIQLVLSELGIASAGRGADLNAMLRRTNPTLQATKRALDVLGVQRTSLKDAIRRSDRLLAELRRGKRGVREFVSRASDVTGTTATHRRALEASIRELPSLLGEVRRTAVSLGSISTNLAPTATELARSAPHLRGLNDVMPSLSSTAVPALKELRPALRRTNQALPALRRFAARLKGTTDRSSAGLRLASELLVNLRDRNGIQELLHDLYILGVWAGAFDSRSHQLAFGIAVSPRCIAEPTARGCVHKFNSENHGQVPVNDPANDELPDDQRARSTAGGGAAAAAAGSNPILSTLSTRERERLAKLLEGLVGR